MSEIGNLEPYEMARELIAAEVCDLFADNDSVEHFVLLANCSDVFAWGCADCEPVSPKDITSLYERWKINATWGPMAWACKKRNMQPQSPVRRDMEAAGCWNSDLESLPENAYDAYLKQRHQERNEKLAEVAE